MARLDPKFASQQPEQWLPHNFGKVYAHAQTSSSPRLCVGASFHGTALLRELTLTLTEPFLLLYVLVVPRVQSDAGRYQSDELSRSELDAFIEQFGTFWDGDGRHNIWIRSADGGMLVYDRHNLIFAYGPLQRFKSRVSICRDRMTPATSWHRSRTAPFSCFPGNSQSHSTCRLSYRTCLSRACSRQLSETSRTVSWTASKPCCQHIMDPFTLCQLELISNTNFQSGLKSSILLNQALFWFPSIPLHPQPRLST